MTTSIEITESEDVALVRLSAERDGAAVRPLANALKTCLDQGRGIVLELSTRDFVDSGVYGAVLNGLRGARERGIGFALVVATSGSERRVSLLDAFPAFERLDEAVRAVRQRAAQPNGFHVPDDEVIAC